MKDEDVEEFRMIRYHSVSGFSDSSFILSFPIVLLFHPSSFILHPSPLLPLAAGSADLFGLLFFVIVAIIGALGKRGQQQGDSEKTGPDPQVPKKPEQASVEEWMKQLTTPPTQASPRKTPEQQPAETFRNLRRAAQEKDIRETYVRPTQHAPERPTVGPRKLPPPLTTRAAPRKTFGRQMPPLPALKTKVTSVLTSPPVEEGAEILADVQKATSKLQEEMEVLNQASPYALTLPDQETTAVTTAPRPILSLLRSSAGLKQAVMVAEVLGKPRALSPLN